MKIRISTLTQYLLIYIMLIMSYSCMAVFYLNQNILNISLLCLFAILLLKNKKYRNVYAIFGILILLAGVVFQRLLSGGVGLSAFLQLAMPVLCANLAICSNKKEFLNRYIKVVCIFAVISDIFWATFLVFPELEKVWPAVEYFTQAIGSTGYERYWHGKGVLLYSFLEIHPTRNCGIYSEPGVYQIVLNSALFILLFWKDRLVFKKEKDYNKALLIIFITLASCQSTTGYISMLIIIAFFMLQKRSNTLSKTKRRIVVLTILSVILLLIEYSINGTNSILHQQIIQKLFGDSKSFTLDLTKGSGQYRLGTIVYCLDLITRHPLGVGYDAFSAGKDVAMVAASLLSFACIYGVVTWAAVLIWLLAPVIKREKTLVAIAFILMFVNTTLGQTLLLYPAQVLFPLYLSVVGVTRGTNYKQDTGGGLSENV